MSKFLQYLLIIFLCLVSFWFYFKQTKEIIFYEDKDYIFFKDSAFELRFLSRLGKSVCQAADINECLDVAKKIKDGDFESWYQAWNDLAERIHNIAQKSLDSNHKESAKETFLRACNYYQAAEFYLHGNKQDPRIAQTYNKSQTCFTKFIELSPLIESVKIPYKQTSLPGFFYHSDSSLKKKPTIIIITGFDGTQEGLYVFALGAIKRGYNVLTLEGPGQGIVIRKQGLSMRADWEHVITPAINYLLTRAEVNREKLVLYGLSLGGYFAARAATQEHRIKLLVINGGIYDTLDALLSYFEKIAKNSDDLLKFIKNNSDKFDFIIHELMSKNNYARWFFEHGMYVFMVDKPSDFILKFAQCSLKGIAQKITATTLVCESENEMPLVKDQAQKIYAALSCPKEFMHFTSNEGAGYHCQAGAYMLSNQRIYDWVDEHIEA